MSSRRIIVVVSVFLIALMISATPMSTSSELMTSALVEHGNPEIADWPPPVSGDWVIDDVTVVTGETFQMIAQRIIVKTGGALVLIDCTLTMTSTVEWYPNCYFEVQEGGNLTLSSTTVVAGSSYRWLLNCIRGSILDIRDSVLQSHWPKPSETGTALVNVEEGQYTRIVGSTISDIEGVGVEVNSANAIITNNDILRTTTGLYVWGSPKANITGNTISNCGYGNPGTIAGNGFLLTNCPGANVSYNSVGNVAQFGYVYSTSSRANALAAFTGNTLDSMPVLLIENNDAVEVGPGYAQILINNSTGVTVRNFEGNGIVASFADRLTLRNSVMSHGGVHLSNSKDVVIADNNISDTMDHHYGFGSMVLGYCDNCSVRGNTVRNGGNGVIGISVHISPRARILDNTIDRTGEWGIELVSSDDSFVTGNHISDSAWDGIRVFWSSNVVISHNTINRTTAAFANFFTLYSGFGVGHGGVYLEETENILVTHNTIMNVIGDAVYVYSSPHTTVDSNTVWNVAARAIQVDASGTVTVADNVVNNITWIGIGFDGCSDVAMVNNTLTDIAGLGFNWYNKLSTGKFSSYANNSLDGRPVGIFQDEEHLLTGTDLAGVIAVNCPNAVIDNLNGNGLVASHSPGLVARRLKVSGGGIALSYSENSTIVGCEVRNIPSLNMSFSWGSLGWGSSGIDIRMSSGSKVIGSSVNNTGFASVYTLYTDSLYLACNNISHSRTVGLLVVSCRDSVITADTFNHSSSNFIRYVNSGKANTYLNAFGDCEDAPIVIDNSVSLKWDNGTHGNYWEDYSGVDSNSDGIGDTPYVIGGGNIDQYPLMGTALVQEHGRNLAGGPEVTDFSFLPPSPNTLDNITVEVIASAFSGIASVTLSYSVDGGTTWTNVTMSQTAGVWGATLPRLPAGEVLFFAMAEDNLGTVATYDLGKLEVAAAIDLVVPLVISGVGIAVVIGLAFVLHRRR